MKIKLGVFFGGKSVEHEVSIITALQAIENINKEKYDVIPIYISKDNKMYVGGLIADIREYKNLDNLLKNSEQVTLAQKDGKVALIRVNKKIFASAVFDYIDIAFPIVHGTNVEDGTLQGFLKMFNIPYVGCDVTSSAVGMDKYVAKCVLKENGLPVLDCKRFDKNEYYNQKEKIVSLVEDEFKYPVIVKPVNLGSSVGIEIAKNKEALEEAIEKAFEYSNKVLVEKAITNLKEVNCSVIGDWEDTKASECEEPVKTDEILSYKDKYISGGKAKCASKTSMNAGVLKLPADITKNVKEQIQTLAKKTFKAIGCSGVIRIDFLIDMDEDKVYINELNTIPGSLSFHLWREAGLKYSDELDEIINLALKRNREENSITYSFESNILAGYEKNGLKGLKGIKNIK